MSVSEVKRIGGLPPPREEAPRPVEKGKPSSGTGYTLAEKPSKLIGTASGFKGVYGSPVVAKPAVKEVSLEGADNAVWYHLIADVFGLKDPSLDLHRNPLRNA
ncbi:MAG: hypothetical protein HY073_02145 [Deltaproteobacteria bacterium]|nr:hypothetical protein [Deltaproteobacteria bacterium]